MVVVVVEGQEGVTSLGVSWEYILYIFHKTYISRSSWLHSLRSGSFKAIPHPRPARHANALARLRTSDFRPSQRQVRRQRKVWGKTALFACYFFLPAAMSGLSKVPPVEHIGDIETIEQTCFTTSMDAERVAIWSSKRKRERKRKRWEKRENNR